MLYPELCQNHQSRRIISAHTECYRYVRTNILNRGINLINIYRLPNNLVDICNTFIEEFSPEIKKLESNKNEAIIAGDFNLDLLKLNEKNIISEYFDMLTSNSFYPKITLPTRLTNNHGTLIDNFFCKLTEHTLDTFSGILIRKFSDHQPYFTILNSLQTKKHAPKYIIKTKQDTQSILDFEQEAITSLLQQPLETKMEKDPNINLNKLHDILQTSKNKHLPSKLIRLNKYKHKKSPWITYGIIHSIEYRDKLYKKKQMTNSSSLEYNNIVTNLKTYNTILKKSIRLAQKNYYEIIFMKLKDDIKGTWKTINGILSKTKRKNKFPNIFKENGIPITDTLDIANKFNNFFINIGPSLSKKINMPQNKTYKDYLLHKYTTKLKFHIINEDVVSNIIDKLNPKNSFGFDGISMNLIKKTKTLLIEPLTIIINQMITNGIFPDKLKISKVIPIHKKDDKQLFTNYRPISLLPSISKIFEKVIFNQTYKYFQDQKLFYNAQYGFRTEHSSEYAALELIDRVITEMDNDKIPFSIFLDLSKAFATLDHTILLEKLRYYGVDGAAHRLFENYLKDRKQYVDIDGTSSEMKPIIAGVPQGSILGPLLFIIYINDITFASNFFYFIIYADDTTLETTIEIAINKSLNANAEDKINI
jgi:hypothetical protein